MAQTQKMNIQASKWALIFNYMGIIGLVAIWGMTLWNYSSLPDLVPVHFDLNGSPDRMGGKELVLVLPFICSVLYIGLSLLKNYPHRFNYFVKITPENAERQYAIALHMTSYFKFLIVVVFGYIEYQMIRQSHGTLSGLGRWFAPLCFALFILPALYFMRESFKNKTV